MPKTIYFFHLLNDYSGSPKVLSQIIKDQITKGHQCHIFTSKHDGFLSNIKGAHYHLFTYNWHRLKVLTLFKFFFTNLVLLLKTLGSKKADVYYINTLLPFAAALGAKIKMGKVIYHVHETSIKPLIFKKFLKSILNLTAQKAIYVSRFLAQQERTKPQPFVVYNALESAFLKSAEKHHPLPGKRLHLLMLCSLKQYKGIDIFVTLARQLKAHRFTLVLNCSKQALEDYFQWPLPENLALYSTQKNVHEFYQKAHVVLNLSLKDQWVETFGLTAIEAFAYGLPVIVPPVGGIAEIVTHNCNGFHQDAYDQKGLIKKIQLLTQLDTYQNMSKQAKITSKQFAPQTMLSQIDQIIHL